MYKIYYDEIIKGYRNARKDSPVMVPTGSSEGGERMGRIRNNHNTMLV